MGVVWLVYWKFYSSLHACEAQDNWMWCSAIRKLTPLSLTAVVSSKLYRYNCLCNTIQRTEKVMERNVMYCRLLEYMQLSGQFQYLLNTAYVFGHTTWPQWWRWTSLPLLRSELPASPPPSPQKVKLSLCLIKHCASKMWNGGGRALCIHNIGTR